MPKAQKIGKRLCRRRQRHGEPARHTIAKQSAAVLTLGLGLMATAPAEASIVYTSVNQTFSGQDILDFLNYPGAGNMFSLIQYGYSGSRSGYKYVLNSASLMYCFHNFPNSNGKAFIATDPKNFAYLLHTGDQISGSLNWFRFGGLGQYNARYGKVYSYGNFLGNQGYVGLQFDPGDGAHYGWAEFSMTADGSSLTFYGYAYQTAPGTPIQAGAVPLPGSLLLLASGAAGLLAYRRMRRAA